MSPAVIDPSYTPADGAAARSLPLTSTEPCVREKLALVIPTLREAENIRGLLDHVRSVLNPLGCSYEILVVDDDSRDGTEEIVASISLEDPRVRLLVRKGERGLSGAILHGWRNTDAEILGVMDADLQHPPELLPALLGPALAGCDLVIGSRYTEGGRLGDWNLARKLFSAAAVWATWPIQRAGMRAKDPMSGYFLVRRSGLEQIRFQPSGFKLLLEILVRGRIHAVKEVPFAFGSRYRGASKANFKVAVDYARLLARLYAERFSPWRRGAR
jgi:dolichol-phosphate mannosyltransferase